MKNKMTSWLVGGLVTTAVFGAAFGVNSMGNAAAKPESALTTPNMMMQNGQMNPEMMNSPELQKQCGEMMASPEMQKTMMKQMIASDPAFKQMLSDLINSADAENATGEQAPAVTQMPASIDHNAHHMNQ